MLMSPKAFGQVQSFWQELMILPPISIPGMPSRAAHPQHSVVSVGPLLSWQGLCDPSSRSLLAGESAQTAFS